MEESINTKWPVKTITSAAVMILIAGIVLIFIYGKTLLVPLVAGAFIAMLLVAPVNKLESYGVPRILSIVIMLLFSMSVLGALGWFFGLQIAKFAEDLTGVQTNLDKFIENTSLFIEENFGVKDAISLQRINDQVFKFLKEHASGISSAAFSTLGSLGSLILLPVYMFMFLLYRDHFTTFAVKLFHKHSPAVVVSVVTDLRKVIQNYISGVVKVMAILAILNIIALSALGIKHAFFFGIFAAMMNILPYVGPLIGSTLPMIFALLTKDSLFYPVAVLMSFVIIQSIEGNFLTPKIVGSNVNINPIVSLIALLIGSLLWGVVGMILFIPLAAIVKKLLELSPSTAVYGYMMGEEPSNKPPKEKRSLRTRIKSGLGKKGKQVG